MNNKKTIIGLVAGISMMLVLSIFPQKLTLAGPGNDCSWGYSQVESAFWPWNNDTYSKFCNCTNTPKFMDDGNNIPCPQPE